LNLVVRVINPAVCGRARVAFSEEVVLFSFLIYGDGVLIINALAQAESLYSNVEFIGALFAQDGKWQTGNRKPYAWTSRPVASRRPFSGTDFR
jgi:hypothetical protein